MITNMHRAHLLDLFGDSARIAVKSVAIGNAQMVGIHPANAEGWLSNCNEDVPCFIAQ